MTRAEYWRGSPTATTKSQFESLLRTLKLSRKRDVFYDIGCGYGMPCIWIANRVKVAVGVENFWPRYKKAFARVQKSGLCNVEIVKKSFQNISLRDATIIHCVITLGLRGFRKIQRETRQGTVLALCYPPPYPIRSGRAAGGYFLMTTPFERVKDEEEYARIYTGAKGATIRDVSESLRRAEARYLRWQVSHADYVWESIACTIPERRHQRRVRNPATAGAS